MTKRLIPTLCLLTLSVTTFAACGDDDDDDTGTGGSTARGGAQSGGTATSSGGSAGRGGSGGSAGAGGAKTSGGTAGKTGTGGTATSGGTAGNAGTTSTGGNVAGAGAAGLGGEGGVEGGAGGTVGGGGGAGGEAGVGGAGGAGGGGAVANLTDGQIILVIDTLNGGEVEVAFAALPKLTNAQVTAFANEMITAHGIARTANSELAKSQGLVPAPSDVQAGLKVSADAQVLAFQTSTAPSLDAAYIDSQVSMHTDALTLAERLFSAAETPQLRNELRAMVTDITAHLDEAEAIRAEL